MDFERAAEELAERKVVRRGLLTGIAALGAAAVMHVKGAGRAEAAAFEMNDITNVATSETRLTVGAPGFATPVLQVLNGASALSGRTAISAAVAGDQPIVAIQGAAQTSGFNGSVVGVQGIATTGLGGIGVRGVTAAEAGVQGEAIGLAGYGIRAVHLNDGIALAAVSNTGGTATAPGNGSGIALSGRSGSGFGVVGESTTGIGVQGQSIGVTQFGVRGVHGANGTGIKGVSNAGGPVPDGDGSGIGVHGKSKSGDGVRGESQSGNGMQGFSPTNLGVLGVSQSGAGVWGQSSSYVGVVGYSISGAIAVFGNSQGSGTGVYGTSNGGSGVIAVATTANAPALHAENTTAGAGKLAARFVGNVLIQGSYTATGTKSAIVPHPDGSMRTLYCTEATEAFFEDYGRAQLAAGVARVQIDPNFAPLVQRNGYHVFLTPEGPSNNLYIGQQDANGFEVREMGGRSGIPFSYRIVAKRVDVPGERLKRVDPSVLNSAVQKAPQALANTPGAGGPIQPVPAPTQQPAPNSNGNTPAPFVPTVPPANVVPVPFNPITPPGFGQYMPPGLPPAR